MGPEPSQQPFSLSDEFVSYIGIETADAQVAMNAEATSKGYIFDFEIRGYLDDSVAGKIIALLSKGMKAGISFPEQGFCTYAPEA